MPISLRLRQTELIKNSAARNAVNTDRNYQIDSYENQNINNKEDEIDEVGRVNISLIDTNKKLSDCSTLLEFAITGLSKHLSLKPKQVVGLLANNNKYLAVGLVKGMKTSFQPLCDWLQSLYVNIKTVMSYIEQNNSDLFRFLDMIKPGLQSSSEQISLWASRIISKICFEVSNTDILPQTYQWFVKENGGLQSCIFCLKRHKAIKNNVVQIITQIAKHNLSDLFVIQLRKLLDTNEEYMGYVSQIFPLLIEISNYKEELQQNRILDYWIEMALKQGDYDPMKNSVSCRQISLGFLSDCWVAYPVHLSENLQVSNQILDMLKKGSRDYSEMLKIHSLGLLFHLLESFAAQRDHNTALIYKKLIFSLIENSSDTNLREFMLRNFQSSFKRFSSMPPEILLDPFIKQIQLRQSGNIFQMNVCDIEFFTSIISHPSLALKTSIQMLDMLSKTYLNEIVWSQSIFGSIKFLVEKFIESEAFQEYVIKLSEVALQMVRDSYKRQIQPPGRFQQDYTTEQEQVILEAQRRALIIELIKIILSCRVDTLNNQIKKYIIQAQQELLASGIQYKGIHTLLGFFGDPNQVVEDYKKEEVSKQPDFEFDLFKLKQGKQLKEGQSGNNSKKDIFNRNESERKLSQKLNKGQDIEWGSNFDSVPQIKPKMNNFTYSKESEAEKDASPRSPSKAHPNTYGANRMDFSQYEESLMQEFNKKDKEAKRGRQEKTKRRGSDAYQDSPKKERSSTLDKHRSQSQGKRGALERRKDELELIREKREKKYLLEDLERMQRAQKEQQLKKITETEVLKIHTKLNVAKNKQTDQAAKIVYKENELDSLRGLNKYKILEFGELEERDKESLDIIIKQYSNTFKFIFNKYCNAHKTFSKNLDSFQDKKQVAELISFADILSLSKDYDLQKFANKEDVLNIMKQTNSNPPFTFLKYTDFIQFLVQLSIFIFKQPPKDLRGFPLGHSLRELFKTMGIVSKRKGENPAIFENPECCVNNMDAATIKGWNAKLLKQPETQLPENLKKVTEKSYALNHEFDDRYLFGLGKGYSLAYQIVSDIMKEQLGVNLLENTMKVVPISLAKPKPIPQMFEKGRMYKQNNNPNASIFGTSESTVEQADPLHRNTSPHSLQKSKKQNMSLPDVRGNATVKGGRLKGGDEYQSLWVQKYSQYGLAGIQKGQPRIVNQALLEKQKKEEADVKAKDEKDKKIKERQQELLQLKKDLDGHKNKKIEDKKLEEQKQQEEKDKQREKQDQQRREQLRKKEELLKHKEQEGMKKLQEKEDQLRKQLEVEMKNKQQQDQFKQKQNQKVNVHLEQIKEKKAAQEEDKAKEKEKIENQKKAHQLKNEKAMQKEKARKELTDNIKNALIQLEENQEIQAVFEKNNKSLQILFSQYKIYKDPRNKADSNNEFISYSGFTHICSHFKICPDIITSDGVQTLFKAAIRDTQDASYGIKYEQFEQLLLRISVKGSKYFDSIAAQGEQQDENNNSIASLVQQGKNKANKIKNDVINSLKNNQEQTLQQELESIQSTSATTLQGLIQYLDLPQDKNILLSKIKAYQGDKLQAPKQINATSSSLPRESSAPPKHGREKSQESRSQGGSLEPKKKYPKNKKYKNIQSKFNKGQNGQIFTVAGQNQ